MKISNKIYFVFLFVAFLSCTKSYEIADKYKIWAPYTSKVDLYFYSTDKLICDTLFFTDLDRDDIKSYSAMYTYTYYDEHMFCIQKSKVFRDLSFSTSLNTPSKLWFAIVLDNKGTYFDIDLSSDLNKLSDNRIKYFNEYKLNKKIYNSVFELSDSLRGLKLYYSPLGIIGYVINKDTMTLKENK